MWGLLSRPALPRLSTSFVEGPWLGWSPSGQACWWRLKRGRCSASSGDWQSWSGTGPHRRHREPGWRHPTPAGPFPLLSWSPRGLKEEGFKEQFECVIYNLYILRFPVAGLKHWPKSTWGANCLSDIRVTVHQHRNSGRNGAEPGAACSLAPHS